MECPDILLFGLPNLSIQTKWALIALMRLVYSHNEGDSPSEGPYQLSLRQIAAITGVEYTTLRNRGGKDPREGILDRLQSIGYVTVIEAKPVNDFTGREGRLQTYLYIHVEKIWDDNARFVEQQRKHNNRDQYMVREDATPYFIYALVNPLTDIVGYVGITNNPRERHKQHLSLRNSNPKKKEWIQSLQTMQVEPEMRILETVVGQREAEYRETWWIQHYLGLGAPLTNFAKR